MWIFEVDRPAIVLGSRQAMIDAPGVEVVRRSSGGGAVHVEPGGTLWVDVVVPRGDPFWDDDVGRATYWLGDLWAEAIGGGVVHRGPMIHARWSDVVCFAGIGPGEVTVDGRKVVGISQRRTRVGARFQCVAYERWNPGPLVELLGVDEDLADVGAGVECPLAEVERSLLAALPH